MNCVRFSVPRWERCAFTGYGIFTILNHIEAIKPSSCGSIMLTHSCSSRRSAAGQVLYGNLLWTGALALSKFFATALAAPRVQGRWCEIVLVWLRYPLVMTNIAMGFRWPIEIDGLPWFTELNSMVIFHGKPLVITRWYVFWWNLKNRPIGSVTRHFQLILACAGRACLELGAGTGVVGLTLGRLGADFHQHSATVLTSTVVTSPKPG